MRTVTLDMPLIMTSVYIVTFLRASLCVILNLNLMTCHRKFLQSRPLKNEHQQLTQEVTITILGIISRSVLFKTRRFGDWILSPSSGVN
jgi:hypothetical protein